MPAPNSRTDKIKHEDPALKITTTQKSQQGELTNTRNLTTDGKESVNKMRTMAGEQDVKSTTTWNGNKLANAFKLDIQGSAIDINETWELSDGGKVLSVAQGLPGRAMTCGCPSDSGSGALDSTCCSGLMTQQKAAIGC